MSDSKKVNEPLSQTAKSFLIDQFKQEYFGYNNFKGNVYTQKGILMEDTAIKASGLIRGKTYSKNTDRKQNDCISGECDVWDKDNKLIIDTKCSWDIGTHPFFLDEATKKSSESGYIWQMHGYMWLYDCEQANIDYWLFPTPMELLKPWEQENEEIKWQHTDNIQHIPLLNRKTTVVVERSEAAIEKIAQKARAAQHFYQCLEQQYQTRNKT